MPRFLADIAAGTAPDVFRLPDVVLPEWVAKHTVRPLDPYIARDRFDLRQFPEGTLGPYVVGGKRYGLPTGFNGFWTFYNQELVDAAGVRAPARGWTWDDYLSGAAKVAHPQQQPPVWGALHAGELFDCCYWYALHWVWNNGGDLLDPTGTRVTVTSPR